LLKDEDGRDELDEGGVNGRNPPPLPPGDCIVARCDIPEPMLLRCELVLLGGLNERLPPP